MGTSIGPERAPQYRSGMSADEYKARYGDLPAAKLGSNENAFGTSARVIEAIGADSLHRYPPMGDDDLRKALARRWGLTPDHFVTGNGAVDVLSLIAQWALRDGTDCVISRPTFPVYEFLANRHGAAIRFADLDPLQFSFDVDAILNAVTGDTRLVFVCSPNNPTGTTCPLDSIERLLSALPPTCLLVLDEVYHHFSSNPRTGFGILERNVMLVHSFSKAYGLAGARLGYGIAQPSIATEIGKYRLPFHINALTYRAGIVALDDEQHVTRTVSLMREGRDRLFRELGRFDVEAWPSEANFVLFKPKVPAEALYEALLRRGVIVRPLSGFYLPDCLRVSAGTKDEIDRFVAAMEGALAELAGVSA